jgi:hypothetical protein
MRMNVARCQTTGEGGNNSKGRLTGVAVELQACDQLCRANLTF